MNVPALSNQTKGTLFCALGALTVSPNALMIRKLSHMDPFAVQFYSYIIFAGAVGIVYALVEGRNTPRKFKSVGWSGLFASTVNAALLVVLTIAFQKTAAANALVILAANPLFSAILSYLVLKESVPRRTILASLVCFGAIVLIFSTELGGNGGNSSDQVVGIICALVSSFLIAAYFIILSFVEKSFDPHPDMIPCVILTGLIGAYSMDGLYLTINGALLLGVSQVFYTWGPGLISAPEVSLYTLLETVLGPVWVWLGGYEAPPVMAVYGGTALVIALAVHSVVGIREEARERELRQQGHVPLSGVAVEGPTVEMVVVQETHSPLAVNQDVV